MRSRFSIVVCLVYFTAIITGASYFLVSYGHTISLEVALRMNDNKIYQVSLPVPSSTLNICIHIPVRNIEL